MEKLKQEDLSLVEQYITENCRLLEKKLFDYHFKGASTKDVIFALKLYQNEDGGFGQGLESDFRLPDSSPTPSILTDNGGKTRLFSKETESMRPCLRSV